MGRLVLHWACVFALVALPVVGCGDHITIINIGTGGTEGSGGSGGDMGDVFPCTEQGIRDAIAKGGGPYTFACNGPTTTVVTQSEIIIDNDVILDGGGNLAVDGNQAHRVFSVAEGATVELRRFVLTGGAAAEGGGGILNEGTLRVTNSTISGNTADGNGGGIDNHARLTLTNSTVSGNRGGSGGGIYVGHAGTLTVTNSTLSGNTTQTCGGGIDIDGAVTLTNSTISGNTANNCGGGIFNQGSLAMTSSIVSSNSDNDCDGDIISDGYNIESSGDTCGFDQGTDQVNVTEGQLNLGPLQDNGGPTETRALMLGSVAIDVIPEAACVDADDEPLTEDQRGVTRPQGAMCDVGAFEVQP